MSGTRLSFLCFFGAGLVQFPAKMQFWSRKVQRTALGAICRLWCSCSTTAGAIGTAPAEMEHSVEGVCVKQTLRYYIIGPFQKLLRKYSLKYSTCSQV